VEVALLEFAERDIEDGFAFYEQQQAGLGDYFLDSVFADIDSLILYAGVHREIHGFYRLLAHKFPFAIYYEIAVSEARVWAVIDCRRDPRWIKTTLSKRRTKRQR
jgi:plasmid stabilization system protein ParE